MAEWTTVGSLVKIQVAGQRIRNGPVYNPEPLLEVAGARLSADGVVGFDGRGWVLDSHHRSHPERTAWKSHRVLLIGFEANYRRLWEEFRPVALGTAGENLIFSSDRFIAPEEAAGGIRIGNGEGEVVLETAGPAIACLPFTRFMLEQPDAPDEELAEPRNRLSQGLRGFVTPYDREEPFDVRPGAEVAVRAG